MTTVMCKDEESIDQSGLNNTLGVVQTTLMNRFIILASFSTREYQLGDEVVTWRLNLF